MLGAPGEPRLSTRTAVASSAYFNALSPWPPGNNSAPNLERVYRETTSDNTRELIEQVTGLQALPGLRRHASAP